MENNFALQKQTGNFMARANSAVGMFKVFSSLCKRLTVWCPSSWVGVEVPICKVVAKTHDNDNDLYDKYTRVSTGLIFD